MPLLLPSWAIVEFLKMHSPLHISQPWLSLPVPKQYSFGFREQEMAISFHGFHAP